MANLKMTRCVVIGLIALFFASTAHAATQSVTANVAFDETLSLNKTADIDFGVVLESFATTYTINTAGAITAGNATWLGGTPTAGSIDISGSATQGITISTGTYTADANVTPSAATCAYDGGGASACDGGIAGAAPGAGGKTLLLGVTATTTAAVTGSAAPTFVVTVVYS